MVEKDFCDICDLELENNNCLCEECGKLVCPLCFSMVKIYRKWAQIGIEEMTNGIVVMNLCNECYDKSDFEIIKKDKKI